jgi:hypothetical protein
MAVVFPKSSNFYVKVLGALIGLGAIAGGAVYTVVSHPLVIDTGYQPEQPVPYSHKLHAGSMGMDCLYCHTTVNRAAFAAVPPTETCMNCHVRVKEKSPRLEPVRQSYATGQPIPWVKIHQLPDYVYFNHSAHINSGVSCVHCHGRVDQMVEVKQVEPLNMGWCIDCHRNPAPKLRPPELVTNLAWKPEGDPAEYGRKIIAEKNINPPVHCSGCHR